MKLLRNVAVPLGAVLGVALVAGPAVQAGDGSKRVEIVRAFGGPRLGVQIADTEGGERGALVKEVEKDSAAEKAGLKEGDVIVRFDGETVRSVSQLRRLVSETPKGRPVPIEVRRGGAAQRLEATLSGEAGGGLLRHFGIDEDALAIEPPEPPEPPRPPKAPKAPRPPRLDFRWDEDDLPRALLFHGGPRKLGIEYQPIDGQLAKYFKAPGDEAVLVTSVEEDGPAAKAGIKAGDLLLKLNDRTVGDGGDLRRALDNLNAGAEVSVQVLREGRSLELKVTLGGLKDRPRPAETT
ncbi:MAG TPA: PDZ domain-containing protein [Vicinamibacteria bacterium]|nr:PDZ domain-containing protein [Vicinamibacteria bacterium]